MTEPHLLKHVTTYPIAPSSFWMEKAKAMGLSQWLKGEGKVVLDRCYDPEGNYLEHQLNVARYMSLLAPRDRLLVFHEMGTGKTRTAICVAERLRKESESLRPFSPFFDQRGTCRGTIVVLKNPTLKHQFREELVYRATLTTGKYMPENAKLLSKQELAVRLCKSVGKWYTFFTFQSFAKRLRHMTDEVMHAAFHSHLIVVDEVQNIKGEGAENDYKKVYSQLHRCFHTTPNLKVMLLTGTPIKNDVTELADLINLLVPVSQAWSNDLTWWKHHQAPEETLQGIVSYIGASETVVAKHVMGVIYPPKILHTPVVIHHMSSFQAQGYANSVTCTNDDEHSFFIHQRQASLFVFPDGSFGRQGFHRYVTVKEKRVIKCGKIVKQTHHQLTDALVQRIKTHARATVDEMIACLAQFSCKYAAVLAQLASSTGNTFIYVTLVNGSGAILFCLLLELVLGMERAEGHETTKKARYMLLSSKTDTHRMLKAFNRSQNLHGDYIRVAIGTRAVSEGITLKNIVTEHMISPFWNTGDTSQAIARGWRFNSHLDLLEAGMTPTVSIYNHVALSENGSIDEHMMHVSESKDQLNRVLETTLKRAAWENGPYSFATSPSSEDWSGVMEKKNLNFKLDSVTDAWVKDPDNGSLQMPWHCILGQQPLFYRHATRLSDVMEGLQKVHHRKRIFRIHQAILAMNSITPTDPREDVHRRVVFEELDQLPYPLVMECVKKALSLGKKSQFSLGFLSFFSRNIVHLDAQRLMWVDATGQMHILQEGVWRVEKETPLLKEAWQRHKFPPSAIGHVGFYNPFLSEFCLKACPVQEDKSDLRMKSMGRKCIDWDFEELLSLVVRIPDPLPQVPLQSKEVCVKVTLEWMKKYQPKFSCPDTLEGWQRLAYFHQLPRQTTCNLLAQWLRDHGLMFEDRNCGHQQKRRRLV